MTQQSVRLPHADPGRGRFGRHYLTTARGYPEQRVSYQPPRYLTIWTPLGKPTGPQLTCHSILSQFRDPTLTIYSPFQKQTADFEGYGEAYPLLPTCSVNIMRVLRGTQGRLRAAQDSTATAQGGSG